MRFHCKVAFKVKFRVRVRWESSQAKSLPVVGRLFVGGERFF